MQYTTKSQAMSDAAHARVADVSATDMDEIIAARAVPLEIRDKEDHDADHISGSVHVSRGKLEMVIENVSPDLKTFILCYCSANNRGALSAARLKDIGYANVRYIAAGMNAQSAKG